MRGIAVIALLVSFLPCPDAAAQPFDPKEAVIGAWLVDSELIFAKLDDKLDQQSMQTLGMVLSMYGKYILEIHADGTLVMGGQPAPTKFHFNVDDEGLLWMLFEDGGGIQFGAIRFEDQDHFAMVADPERGLSVDIPFVRVFPAGMIEEGQMNGVDETVIHGAWKLDRERLDDMPWVKSIRGSEIRKRTIAGVLNRAESLSVSFEDGEVRMIVQEYDDPVPGMDYSAIATEGNTIAIVIGAYDEETETNSMLTRIELRGEDRMDFLIPMLAPGPLPMIRVDNDAIE